MNIDMCLSLTLVIKNVATLSDTKLDQRLFTFSKSTSCRFYMSSNFMSAL